MITFLPAYTLYETAGSCTSYFKIPAILVTVTKHYRFVQHNAGTPCLLSSAVEAYYTVAVPLFLATLTIGKNKSPLKIIIFHYDVLYPKIVKSSRNFLHV